jgi:plasmid stabilization system protein ParE
MDGIRHHYAEKAGEELADRFYHKFISIAKKVAEMPTRYHVVHGILRRAAIKGFPYHFLFREATAGVRILVLRHDKRHPSYGLSRK